MKQTISYQEGYRLGCIDRRAKYAADPYRHMKAWAPGFEKYEQGYKDGYQSKD